MKQCRSVRLRAGRAPTLELHAVDPELARFAVRALDSGTACVEFFARKFCYVDKDNCYAALAYGKSYLVVARLNEFLAGDAGSYI